MTVCANVPSKDAREHPSTADPLDDRPSFVAYFRGNKIIKMFNVIGFTHLCFKLRLHPSN